MSLQKNLKELVRFNTTSSTNAQAHRSNEKLIDALCEHFSVCGYVVAKFAITPNNFNMLALSPALFCQAAKGVLTGIGEGMGKLGILLSGHTDCVPFDAKQWHSNPLELTSKQGLLYGRGTSDMKGFIACAMELAQHISDSYQSQGHQRQYERYPLVSFLFTADEECTMCGAQAFAQLCLQGQAMLSGTEWHCYEVVWQHNRPLFEFLSQLWPNPKQWDKLTLALLQQERFSCIIIGEPTMMQPVVAHKGWLARELHCYGKSGHSSNPAQGVNAIALSKEAITLLEELQTRLTAYQDDHFAVPYPTLSMGTISGGSAFNLICDQVTIGFDLRPTPDLPLAKVNELLEEMQQQLLARLQAHYGAQLALLSPSQDESQDQDCVTLTTPFPDTPAFGNHDEHSLSFIKQLLPQSEWQYVNYATEASFLQELSPCVILGPGDIAQAHTVDEFIAVTQLEQCFAFLQCLADHCRPA